MGFLVYQKVNYKVGKFNELFSSFPGPYVLKPVKGAAKKRCKFCR